MSKKLLATVLSFVLAFSVGFPSNATVPETGATASVEEKLPLYLAGNSIGEATDIDFGTDYYGSVSEGDGEDYYRLELESSGRVTFDVNTVMDGIMYCIYDSTGEEIWSRIPEPNEVTGQISDNCSVDLTQGTYYFGVQEWFTLGNYNFKISFTSAEESFAETGNGTNNDFESANEIETDVNYRGQLAENDEKDFYKMVLSESGEIVIDASAMMDEITYLIYDGEGNEIWAESYKWNQATEQNTTSKSLDLTQGTYYFVAEQCWWNKGNYDFEISFTGAGESFAETGNGTNNDFNAANTVAVDTGYNGQFAQNDDADFYKVELSESGRVTVNANAMMPYITYIIYDSEGKQIWYKDAEWIEATAQNTINESIDLTQGSYFFVTRKNGGYTGNYNFELLFAGAQESFAETGNGSNNEFTTASAIQLNTAYKGQLAENDEKDFYKVVLSSSGRVQIDLTSLMPHVEYIIYDSENNEIRYRSFDRNSVTGQISSSETIDLTKGTYYFLVDKYYFYETGNYDFKLSFVSAGESFTETGYGINNEIMNASTAALDTTYKGQLAANDEKDFYKVTLNGAGRLTLNATAMMENIKYSIFNGEGEELWREAYSLNSVTGKNVAKEEFELTKGTYYFLVSHEDSKTGNYSFNLKWHLHDYKDVITKATTKKDGKIEKKCSCGTVRSSKTIYRPSSIKLSATEFTYDGKAKKPTVKVTGSDGKVINSSNYTVTYPKGRINAGKYKVTITFKGNYSGTTTATFTIKPKTIKSSSKTITLSATEYDYNGKVKKPTVKVKDNNGKVLKSSDYTITYPKNAKNVGTYKVKVTFKGNYKGTATASFTILPKGTTIASLKAESKGFTVKIKKQAKETTGYEIQYSTSSKFNSAVTKTIKKNSTVTQKVTKLKANQKYYVRVRTYKTVSGKKLYSDWSAAKSVKTKK